MKKVLYDSFLQIGFILAWNAFLFGFLSGCAGAPSTLSEKDAKGIRERASKAFDEVDHPERRPTPVPQSGSGPLGETRNRADQAMKGLDKGPTGSKEASAQPKVEEEAELDPDVKVLQEDSAGCTWVEAKATISFGENDTKHQAKAQAVSEARAKAMHRFLGVSLQHQFIDFQQEGLKGQVTLTESLLRVTQLGRVIKEKVLSAGPQDLNDCAACRFAAHIRTCIVPQPDKSDKGFKVTLSLNRTTFKHGDEGFIEITSSRDAYVYIYNVDMDWNAALIFPNDLMKENQIKAGETFIFPPDPLRQRGVRIIAQLPADASVSAETIRVIASKTPLPRSIIDPPAADPSQKETHASSETQGGGSFLHLMRKLNAGPLDWAEDAQAFTIYKK
ncbi:MAG TPA: DUF4384 domain-containing protein [Candidatus Manganitrophaceae bacterium]